MALKSDAYGFLVGAPVEWGRALQIFNEIRDEVRALRGDIAAGAGIKALERAADAVSRQAQAVTRTSSAKAVSRAAAPPRPQAPVRVPKPSAVAPTRTAPVRGPNGRFVSAASISTPSATPKRALPTRGPGGRFVSSTNPGVSPPIATPRRPYQIPVVGVAEVPASSTDRLTNEEFETRRARAAQPSRRDEIRRQNAAMSQARVTPDADEQKAAARAAQKNANASAKAAKDAKRAEASAASDRLRERRRTRLNKVEDRLQAQEDARSNKDPAPGVEKRTNGQFAARAFSAIGEAPEIDPTITAMHEVQAAIAPVGRGLSHLFGRSSGKDAWYKRIWNELRGSRKDQSTFHKAEQRTLQQIDDKTGGAGAGIFGMLGGLLSRIPGLGFLGRLAGGGMLGRVLGAGARGAGSLAGLALRGGKGLFRRIPLLGALFAGGSAAASIAGFGDDPNASPEEHRLKRFTGAGSGIGALVGGGVGTLLGGPVGSVIGGVIGDRVGELVGKWLSTLDWAKIGATITGAWDTAVKGFSAEWDEISGWFKDKFGMVKTVANKANDYVRDKTGVDIKATTSDAAKAVSSVAKDAADVAKKATTAATSYVAERATQMAAPIGNAISSLIEASGVKRIFRRSDGSIEQRDGGSVSWRNNNSGNLKFEYAGSADKTVKTKRTKAQALATAQKRYNGVVDLDQWGNAIFDTQASGDTARAKLLKSSHGNQTVEQMLGGYAKDDYTGKANIGAYSATINKVANARGLNLAGKKISDLSDAEFAALMDGMKQMEGFKVGKTTALAGSPITMGGAGVPAMSSSLPVASVSPGINVPAVADAAPSVPTSLGRPAPVEVRVSKDAGDVGPTVSDPKIARLVSGGLSN